MDQAQASNKKIKIYIQSNRAEVIKMQGLQQVHIVLLSVLQDAQVNKI